MNIQRVLILMLGLAGSGYMTQIHCQSAPASVSPASEKSDKEDTGQPLFGTRTPRYELCPSDELDIAFPYAAEFNQSVTVQPDGYIALREVGDLYVAGKTVTQLVQELTNAYGKVLHDPVVTITLKDFNRPYFTVGGQVQKAGKFELRADTTVTEAIAIAGGFNDAAKHSQVLLVRKVSSEWAEVKKLDVKAMYNKGNLREDIHLRSGDMLYVPKSRLSKVKPFLPIYGLYSTLARY